MPDNLTDNLTDNLIAAQAVLGNQFPGVEITDDYAAATTQTLTPATACAMTATSAVDAIDLAQDLLDTMRKGYPAWRGYGVRYPDQR